MKSDILLNLLTPSPSHSAAGTTRNPSASSFLLEQNVFYVNETLDVWWDYLLLQLLPRMIYGSHLLPQTSRGSWGKKNNREDRSNCGCGKCDEDIRYWRCEDSARLPVNMEAFGLMLCRLIQHQERSHCANKTTWGKCIAANLQACS